MYEVPPCFSEAYQITMYLQLNPNMCDPYGLQNSSTLIYTVQASKLSLTESDWLLKESLSANISIP